MTDNTQPIGRRPVLKGAGVAVAALGGLTGTVAADDEEGQHLKDRPVDILVFQGQADETETDPDKTVDFGYPESPLFGNYDTADDDPKSDLFDFGTIRMSEDGETLHNRWKIFAGILLESQPKPYVLVHNGDGRYQSEGQVMNFKAKPLEKIPDPFKKLPFVRTLAGEKWRAVGTEQAQLELDDDGNPTPNATWGATRVDFYSTGEGRPEYTLSLVFLISYDPEDDGFKDINATAVGVGEKLIRQGRLNLGGQPKRREEEEEEEEEEE